MDFKKKIELFNSFFAKQCTVINSGSSLPSKFLLKTDKFLSNITFSSDDILKIIQNLDSEKPHCHDRKSIRILKICGPSMCKPLEVISKPFLESGIFPLELKKANVVPLHKKNDKQSLANYQPISLLLICGQLKRRSKRLLYNGMFDFFITNHLISTNQSEFKPGDSCINQLLSITHGIYASFDECYEV